ALHLNNFARFRQPARPKNGHESIVRGGIAVEERLATQQRRVQRFIDPARLHHPHAAALAADDRALRQVEGKGRHGGYSGVCTRHVTSGSSPADIIAEGLGAWRMRRAWTLWKR